VTGAFPPALLAALKRGDARALARQLDGPADLEQRDGEGATLLMRACSWPGATACVALLVERGAALEAVDRRQRTPLLYAASAKAGETLALLLEHGANPDPREGLYRSTYEALPELALVERLLAHGARLEPRLADQGLLKSAWQEGPLTLERLVGLGADVDARHPIDRKTPLIVSAEQARPRNVRALLAQGASVDLADARGTTALIGAVTWPYPAAGADAAGTLRELLAAAPDRSTKGQGSHAGFGIPRTALEHATTLGRPDLVRLLDDGSAGQPSRALELGIWQVPIVERRDLAITFCPNDEQATLVLGFGGGPANPGWSTYGTAAEQLTRHRGVLQDEAAWFLPFVERMAGGESVDVEELVRRAGGFLRFAAPATPRTKA
jgi:hypothetical protein